MTTAEALVAALERANGRVLVMRVDARPHVITDEGIARDIGSAEMTAAAMQTLLTELVPESVRVALHREGRIVVPIRLAGHPDHALTVDYADSRLSLRLESASADAHQWSWSDAPVTTGSAPKPAPEPLSARDAPREDLGRWVGAAAAVGATHLYLRAGSPPAVRLSCGIQPLTDRIISGRDMQSALETLQSTSGGWDLQGDGYTRIDSDGMSAHLFDVHGYQRRRPHHPHPGAPGIGRDCG